MKQIYDYIIYTDGGCERNPGGRGGYGAVIIDFDASQTTELSGGFESTTNNRMEVMAVIRALEEVEKGTRIQLFSDSQYVIKTMSGMFRKKKNTDLWRRLDRLVEDFSIDWNWVRGHDGNIYNERCDTLCTEAMENAELKIDTGYRNKGNMQRKEPVKQDKVEVKEAASYDIDAYNVPPECTNPKKYEESYLVNPACAKAICAFYRNDRKRFRDYIDLRTEGQDFWSRKKKEYIMNEREYPEDVWHLICDNFIDAKYQMICLRWCARGLTIDDAIKKVKVDIEVSENCIGSRKY